MGLLSCPLHHPCYCQEVPGKITNCVSDLASRSCNPLVPHGKQLLPDRASMPFRILALQERLDGPFASDSPDFDTLAYTPASLPLSYLDLQDFPEASQ